MRSTFILIILMGLAFTTIGAIIQLRELININKKIELLAAGFDIPVNSTSADEFVIEKIRYAALHDKVEEARNLIETIDKKGRSYKPRLRSHGHYILANAYLRIAFKYINSADLDSATPFINLSKREYKYALSLNSELWEAKYNFDIASRLVRDFPDYEKQHGDELPADPKKLWTDIPGTPKGLP